MKNKKYAFITKLLLGVSILFVASSCKDDYDVEAGQKHTEPPVLVLSNPENGATIAWDTKTVTFTFDRPVTIIDLEKVTIDGVSVTAFSTSENTLTLSLEGLGENAQYTLTIPKGNLKGIPGILNQEDITMQFSVGSGPGIINTLVMPNASAEAKKVYAFLIENYKKKIISGAMAKVNWNTEEADRIYRWTGKYPALNCFDYVHQYANWINYKDTKVAEDWWNSNGLVAAMWHWNVPVTEGSTDVAFYTKETDFDITKALEAGTSENDRIMADLDVLAENLLVLQAKNIPVIWRPLHEAAGGWFWWGAKGGDAYKSLWILMFNTLKDKGVNNLIWVWTTETNDAAWYPGDAYVDIIGRDIYDKETADITTEFTGIKNTYSTKIVSLSECGSVSNISEQWAAGAQWSWFMPWYDYDATDESEHMHATKVFWVDAFATEAVITRDEMPSLK